MMTRNKRGITRKTGIPMVLTSALLLTQLASVGTVARGEAPEELPVYGDSLSSEFVNYSWARSDMAETGIVHGGNRSIMMDPDENQALYFYKDRIMVADHYSSLRFWVHGGDTGGQQLKLVLSLGGQGVAEVPVESLVDGGIAKGQWKLAEVKLADLGISGLLDGIWLWGSGSQEPVYLDDMSFVPKGSGDGGTSSPSPTPTPTPSASTAPGTPSPTPSVTPSATPSGEPTGSPTPSPTPGNAGPVEPVEGVYVYDDALAGSWADYGWAAHSLEESGVVHTGSRSIRFTPSGDDAIYLYSDRILLTKEYEKLQLWVNGGESGSQGVKLVWMSGGQPVTERSFTELLGGTGIPAGQWAKVEVPLADLNLPNGLFDGLLIAGTGGEAGDVFFDDIALISKKVVPAAVLEVRMDVPTAVLLEGDALQLQAESYLEGGETSFVTEQAEWATDREDVVWIENGRVTAVGLGIAKITAAYQGKTAEAYVQVTEAAAEPVYEEGLAEGIRNLSWHDKDMANREEAHSGELSVKFEPDGWDGVWLAGAEKEVTDYYGFRFWIHGGTAGGQRLLFHAYDGYTNLGAVELDKVLPEGRLPAGVWTEVTVRFADLGLTSGQFDGFVFQAGTENDQAAVYIDDVQLLRNLNPGQLPEPEVPAIDVKVDTASGRRAINPDIYGINYDDMGPTKSTLPFAVQRWGGNQTTRYNWELDVANRASDWYFMNYPYDNEHPEELPEGSESDKFIDGTLASGGKVLLTVPTIGWTPKDRSITYGFSQEKYGAQQDSSYELRDAGNGVFRDGSLVTGNDPLDTSKRIGPDFVTRWMDHIKERTGDQVNYYALDNEPEIWHVTHRDVHPNPPTYDEIWGFTKTYATAIKEKDPDAKVFGPVSWGWCAYFYSSADNCAEGPDRDAHGGTPFLEWYLQKVKQEEDSTGVRLVDYLDIHYYPQENGIPTFEEGPAVAKRRLQSLKSLYDPNYVDQSWIQEPIRLIPRMKEIIDRNLPGAKLAITEYNFGNGDGISAGLAQAEALAIFGREGVDLATRFGNLPAGTALEDAFKLYLNYDGKGSKIEGVSVSTVSSLHDAVGAYTIEGTDGKLYVLLFNKDTVTREVGVATDRTSAGSAELYRFDAATRLSAAGTIGVGADGALSLQLPARSATLVIVPAGAAQ